MPDDTKSVTIKLPIELYERCMDRALTKKYSGNLSEYLRQKILEGVLSDEKQEQEVA